MSSDSVITACRCAALLIRDGEIKESSNPKEYNSYRIDPETREMIKMTFSGDPFYGKIIDVPRSGRIYLVAESLGPLVYDRTTYKKRFLPIRDNVIDAYMDCVIILFILHEFYGGKNEKVKQRSFITYSDIIEIVDRRCDAVLATEESLKEAEETGINFINVAKMWKSYILGRGGLTKTGKPRKDSKIGKIIHVVHVLEEERLFIRLPEAEQIRPTTRLDDIMQEYYLSQERVTMIHEYITRLEEKNAEA